MKLYFYTLDTYGENPKGLYVKECEAEEKPKTYKAVDRVFPNYLSTAKKDDVGRITNNCLFLTEPNFEYAKEVFRNRAERRIADKLEEVEKLKTELKIINESEESVTLSNGTLLNTNTVLELLDKYPTAYDVDKVVEQLEQKMKRARDKEQENTSEYFEGEADGFEFAIEIVKTGGKEQ